MGIDFDGLFAAGLPAASGRPGPLPRYNFTGGNNDPDIVPVEALIDSAQRALRAEGRDLAIYNLGKGGLGHPGLRAFVASKLTTQRGMAEKADDILITSGSGQGLSLVNDALLEPGDTVLMEQFSYSAAINRVRQLGVQVVGIPLDEHGLRMDVVASTLERMRTNGVRPKYIYTIPTIQNPTGSVMPLDRRHELLRLSAAYGVPIFEDECYADLLWEGDWPTAIRGLPGGEDVIHVGSFSKSLAPALRLGYVAAPWSVMGRLLALKQAGGTPAIEQMIVADFFGAHFDEHVTKLKKGLRRKLEVLTEALKEHFGTAAEFRTPPGGSFLWVELPAKVDTASLYSKASAEGVAFNPGPEWCTDPEPARHSLRLCFALPPEADIREGVARLAEICHRETGIPLRSGNVER